MKNITVGCETWSQMTPSRGACYQPTLVPNRGLQYINVSPKSTLCDSCTINHWPLTNILQHLQPFFSITDWWKYLCFRILILFCAINIIKTRQLETEDFTQSGAALWWVILSLPTDSTVQPLIEMNVSHPPVPGWTRWHPQLLPRRCPGRRNQIWWPEIYRRVPTTVSYRSPQSTDAASVLPTVTTESSSKLTAITKAITTTTTTTSTTIYWPLFQD